MVNSTLEYHRFWSVIGCEFNQVEHKCETGNRFHGFVSQVNFYSRQLDFNLDIPQIRLDPQKVFDPFSNVLLLWNEYLFETSDRIIPSEADERPCPGRCRTYSGIDFFAFWVILNAIFLSLSRILTGFSNRLNPGQDWHFVDLDLGPNCLQRLSADGKSLAPQFVFFFISISLSICFVLR